MQSITTKQRILLVAGLLVLIGLIVFLVVRDKNNEELRPKVTTYYDADSGQTVTDIEGKSPEFSDADPEAPTFLGFQELLQNGMTQQQVDNVRSALTTYAKPNNVREISLKVSSISVKPRDSKNAIKNVVEFEVKFDRKAVYYKVNSESTGITRTQVRLYDNTGALVHDSGILTGTKGSD